MPFRASEKACSIASIAQSDLRVKASKWRPFKNRHARLEERAKGFRRSTSSWKICSSWLLPSNTASSRLARSSSRATTPWRARSARSDSTTPSFTRSSSSTRRRWSKSCGRSLTAWARPSTWQWRTSGKPSRGRRRWRRMWWSRCPRWSWKQPSRSFGLSCGNTCQVSRFASSCASRRRARRKWRCGR